MDITHTNGLGFLADRPDLAAPPPPALMSTHTPIDGASGRTLHQAAQEFESYFISYLMKTMRETVPQGFLDRKGEQVWYSFYDQEIGRLATESGGIGLTAFIEAHPPGK